MGVGGQMEGSLKVEAGGDVLSRTVLKSYRGVGAESLSRTGIHPPLTRGTGGVD